MTKINNNNNNNNNYINIVKPLPPPLLACNPRP